MVADRSGQLNKAFTVTRTIPLSDEDVGAIQRAVDSLKRIEPIEYVEATGKSRLRLRYDASCVGFREIEHLLDDAQVSRPSSLWWRFKSGWYAFLDQNARSNARGGDGACCSRPPGLSRRPDD
jgi:hypothetical protein